MKETWKDIPNYEGFYQANNNGLIKSLKRVVAHPQSNTKTIKEKILKQRHNSSKYMQVELCKNGKRKCFVVHRLIALSFYGYSNLMVNHKDKNRENNNINNLEFVTNRENCTHGKNKSKSSKYAYVIN